MSKPETNSTAIAGSSRTTCSPSLTPQTDRREYEQECNYEVCWEDHSRKLEKMLTRADGLLRRAIVMVDGWAEAEQWCNELIDMQSPENAIGHTPGANGKANE